MIVESFSKKRKSYIKKDIKPKIKSIHIGDIDLPKEFVEIIDEVSPCKNKGFIIKTEVQSGTSIRPIDLKNALYQLGISVERPIRVSAQIDY